MRHMFCCVVLAIFPGAALSAAVPNPMVIGPIPATVSPGDPSHEYPFFSTTVNLASFGYVEEEFFFEGVANKYFLEPLTTGAIVDGGHPYRTRMVVRRPASSRNFSGWVVMEWQNVAFGFDYDSAWQQSYADIIRRGNAWVGVSAQQAGIHRSGTGLKAWSPSRYGTLDVTQNGTIIDDSLSYDILSQAAQAVRNPVGVDPMGGLRVQGVFATGGSMSATQLTVYHNSIHPLAGVFDAFLLVVGGSQPLRTDLDVKVFKVLSETDVAGVHAALRQSNSNHFRRWEIAGAAHFDVHLAEELAPLQIRDFGSASPAACSSPPFSRIPLRYVLAATVGHLVDWVKYNVEPPTAPDIDTVSITPAIAVIARDSLGNALGGIRLSQHAVSTATNTGLNSGSGVCRLAGSFQLFDAATLDALYPEHGKYVSQVVQATINTLNRGFIVREDAIATIQDGVQSNIGRR